MFEKHFKNKYFKSAVILFGTIFLFLFIDSLIYGISYDELTTTGSAILTVNGEISVTTLDIGGTDVTATAAEINLIDGGTSASATTLAAADRFICNDAGTMKQVALSDLVTFLEDESASSFNIDGGTY